MNSDFQSIGGYHSLDLPKRQSFSDYTLLNSARNCLFLLIKSIKIKSAQVPFYSCPCVWRSLNEAGCKIIPYDVDDNFYPIGIDPDLPIIYTNYFGICERQIEYLSSFCKFLIVDNSQALFSPPKGVFSIYSPRKFIGLPDGGMIWPRIDLPENMEIDKSWDSCAHLLRRIDCGAEEGYEDFKENERRLSISPPRLMSKLSITILEGCDLDRIAQKRLDNFNYLHSRLKELNKLKINFPLRYAPQFYPFLSQNPEIRKILVKRKIYVTKLWEREPACACMSSPDAQYKADHIIPLIIDQRYGAFDMDRIIDALEIQGRGLGSKRGQRLA